MKLSEVFNAESFQEAKDKCLKGYRLPEIWELVKLACEKNEAIFETEKGNFIFFWSNTLVGDNRARKLGRYRYGVWYANWGGLSDSDVGGRVVYFKDEGEK